MKAIVSGSFDPFTNGHLHIVKQACEMFETVYVVIFINAKKTRTYPVDKIVKGIQETLKEEGISNVIVDSSEDLLADYCLNHSIDYTVRGLRNNMDYNYEENIAEVNKLLNPHLKPIYFRTEAAGVSSSMVKELLRYNKDVSKYVPIPILNILKEE